ncbi:MAG TPA: nuclear transport factor 2 family protein [Solirubrobacter sp.]|nr:nuclear transport factor 2 family protein [Solirubrobacter sp.]
MTTLDAALRGAYSARDTDALLALYADDATVEIVDAVHTPSHPILLRGRDALRAHFADVFARDMTHEIDAVVTGPNSLGYSLRCGYPDGTKVVCAATASLAGGTITHELGVQAWDA